MPQLSPLKPTFSRGWF